MESTATATARPSFATLCVPAIFVVTIFLSASLLFFVQPLFTRIVLPEIGGAPAVWTTAMLFFQTTLIAGYLYAHLLTRYVSLRWQVWAHISVWAVALMCLPLAIPEAWRFDPEGSAAGQTLILFALGVGLPFFALSSNAPLIQYWYLRSGGLASDDPYFLYGASNLGSLIALLGFPLLAEPLFGATQIGLGWALGFTALGIFLLTIGTIARGGTGQLQDTVGPAKTDAKPGIQSMLLWAFLAFVPSSLMLAVTSKISLDLGSFPLIWVVPLALYLLSFVVSFSNQRWLDKPVLNWLVAAVLIYMLAAVSGVVEPHLSWWTAGAMVAGFFVLTVLAHRKLYNARPAPKHLTVFYLVMSIGGALGGLFNSIIAPMLFDRLAETGVTLLLAGLLLFNLKDRFTDLPRVFGKGIGLAAMLTVPAIGYGLTSDAPRFDVTTYLLLPAALAVLVMLRRDMLALYGAGLVLVAVTLSQMPDHAVMRDRSFFGTHLVAEENGMRLYGNGTTVHGAQRLSDDQADRPTPLFYYHPNGPMAQVMTSQRGLSAQSVGIVGLGVGSLACYAKPGQDWHFYEIDALVDQIARNTDYFDFVTACTPQAPTYLGDARVVLANQHDLTFDILVIDAYSSDSVPVHLTTREALSLYMDRLNPGGVLVFHISNRYYAIDRPLGRAAENLGLIARIQDYRGNTANDPGDSASMVVTLSRDIESMGDLSADPRWQPLLSDGGRVWTDDFANLLSIMK